MNEKMIPKGIDSNNTPLRISLQNILFLNCFY